MFFFLLFCALVKRFKGLLYLLLNSEIMIALLAIFAFSVKYCESKVSFETEVSQQGSGQSIC